MSLWSWLSFFESALEEGERRKVEIFCRVFFSSPLYATLTSLASFLRPPSSFFSTSTLFIFSTMALSLRASARPVLAMASAAPKAAKPVAKAPKVRIREEMRAV